MGTKERWFALVVLLLAACATANAAINESIVFGVDNFEGAGECSVGGAHDTLYSVSTASKVDDVFDDWVVSGNWDKSVEKLNKAVDDVDFTDSTRQTWGNDSSDGIGMDHADVGFFMTHGARELTGTPSSLFLMGDSSGTTCQVDTDNHILFGNSGNNDLEIVIAASCQSAQKSVFDGGGYQRLRTSSGSFNTWLGYHGLLVTGPLYPGNVKNYFKDTYSTGLGENWVDRMYTWNVTYEVCGVAIVWATSTANCNSVYQYGGMADRNNDGTGSKTTSSYYYIEGCNPQEGEKLPG